MEFFIIDHNGQQAGPFSLDQLVQKGISPETLVWKQGMADWTPAWKVRWSESVAGSNKSQPAAGLSESPAGSLSAGIPEGSSNECEFSSSSPRRRRAVSP